MSNLFWLLLSGSFLIGLSGTGWLRRYALQRSLLDMPNERSSHTVPTPRGGGLSLVVVYLLALLVVYVEGLLPVDALIALSAGLVVAAVAWREDHRPIAPLWRGLLYLIAAVIAVVAVGGLPVLDLGWRPVDLGIMGGIGAVLGVAWLTNLYNFMDGADGLAALQAVTAGLGAGMLLGFSGAPGLALIAFSVASGAAGFLVWNWPPAKIFMGDVGSCLLGFVFAVLALISELQGAVPLLVWLILLSFFIGDASLTLAARVLIGESWYKAHRSHAYKRLIQLGWGHKRLALTFLIYNMLVLWPLAGLAWWQQDIMFMLAVIASVFSIIIWASIRWVYVRTALT